MSRKTLCYEDYFRISNAAANQNASLPNTEPGSENLRKAATILIHNAIHFIKGNQNSTRNVMSGQRGQGLPYGERIQNEQFQQSGPHFDDRRHMMEGEPERLRPLETCESYEQSSWNQPEYRRQDLEQGMHYEQTDYSRYERNIFRNPSHCEMQYERTRYPENADYEFGRQPGYDDRQTYHDRQQFYNRQPDRQSEFERQREFHSDKYQSVGDQFISGSQVSTDEQQNTPAPGRDKGDRRQVEEDDENEEDTSYCSVCKIHFDNAQKYYVHIRGMLHTQRQIAAGSDGGEGAAEVKEDNRQRPPQYSERQESGTHQQENQTDQGDNTQEENADDDEDTSFCKLCSVHFDTPQKYFLHTRGMLHTQRQLEANKSKFGVTEEEVQWQKQLQEEGKLEHLGKPRSVASSALKDDSGDKEDDEQYEENWEEWEVEENKPSNIFICELCDIQTTGIQALRAHENGRNHRLVQKAVENGTTVPQRIYCKLGPKAQIPNSAKPITAIVLNMLPASGPSVLLSVMKNIPEAVVGTEFVKEGRSGRQPTFLCTVCESTCDTTGIISHLIGSKHRMKYLKMHQPTVYEHVRNHGGKKSELSAFLEQVCSDVEKKEGRKKPMMDKPDDADQEKNEAEKEEPTKTEEDKEASEDEKEEKKEEEEKMEDQETPLKKEKKKDKQPRHTRRYLPHDVVMAMYKEGKNREDHYGAEEGPFGGRGFDDHPREPFRFGFGRGGPTPNFGPPQMGRSPYFPFPGRPEPYPSPFMDYPNPFIMSEEERLNHMYSYEKYLFDYPMLLISPEEARHRMFDEYERLGIPYDIACDRVMLQEERRVKIMNYMKEGLSLKDAQTRLRKFENRKRLIREYEVQGLDTREARWRAVVEEERENLYEKYEKLGFSPLEARAKIMAGEDRMHLIQEFERHGMTPEEAQRRAVHEEDRLKDFEASSAREQSLDDIADRRMLETYLEQGDTREQADNKVIAMLRRQGVPTQEAILRVQKIIIKVPEKREKGSPLRKYDDHKKVYERAWSPRSHDDYKKGSDRELSPRSRDDPKKDQNQEGTSGSRQVENFDNITPEEAKERLFQEYEKRGVPREKARLALIQELIRSGVPEEEAKRRFRDTRLVESTSREEKEKQKKHSRYKRSRSCSSSSSSSSYKRKRCSPTGWKRSSKLHRDDRIRADVHDDRSGHDKYPHSEGRKREDKFPFRRERNYDRGLRGSKNEERYKEPSSRPTLTLGEELKLKARKLKRAELLDRLEETSSSVKQAKPSTSQSSAEKHQSSSKQEKSVSNLLESLTDSLISSEDNESAMSMSKALTSALLKYRLNSSAGDREKPSGSTTQSSFVERRIQDAKKLFETKMLPPKDNTAPSGSDDYGGSRNWGLQRSSDGTDHRKAWGGQESRQDTSGTVRPESFGLPPPLPAYARNLGSMASQPRPRTSSEKKPKIPRVLLG